MRRVRFPEPRFVALGPGGLGIDRPARDRTARCWLHWCRRGSSRLDPVIPGSAARAESEAKPSAHDRGGAPQGEGAGVLIPRQCGTEAMVLAASADRRLTVLLLRRRRFPVDAPNGAPPPFLLRGALGRAFLKRAANLGCQGALRERDLFSSRPRAGGGKGAGVTFRSPSAEGASFLHP